MIFHIFLDGLCGPLLGKHRLIPVFSCCSCTGEPSMWGQCSRCILTVLSRMKGSHLSTFLQHFTTNNQCWAFFATRARCWPTCNLLTIRMPRSLSAKLPSSWSSPSLSWCEGLFLPRCRIWHFLGGSCQCPSPACQHPSERQRTHLVDQPTTPPSFVSSAICINMYKLPCCIWADPFYAFLIVAAEYEDLTCIVPGLYSTNVSHVSFSP